MSGLTKDKVITLERQTKAILQHTHALRDDLIQQLAESDAKHDAANVALRSDLFNHADRLAAASAASVDALDGRFHAFAAMGLMDRILWVVAGRLPRGVKP